MEYQFFVVVRWLPFVVAVRWLHGPRSTDVYQIIKESTIVPSVGKPFRAHSFGVQAGFIISWLPFMVAFKL